MNLKTIVIMILLLIVTGESLSQSEEDKHFMDAKAFSREGNYKQALLSYEKSAELGNVEALERIGELYTFPPVGPNAGKALKYYKQAFEKGFISPYGNGIAKLYQRGRIVKHNGKKAAEWYMKSAAKGSGVDMEALCYLYYKMDYLVPTDEEKSFYWCKKAANNGVKGVWMTLGSYYMNGTGTRRDMNEAVYWFSRVTKERANLQIAGWLGDAYYYGKGLPKDRKQSFYWYKTIENIPPRDLEGYREAHRIQYNIGMMYGYGIGTLKDLKKAKYWIKKAHDNNFEDAQKVWNDLDLWKY